MPPVGVETTPRPDTVRCARLVSSSRTEPATRFNRNADYLENIRSVIRDLALEGGLRDPDAFALSWHILMKGSIVQAAEGDRDAAKRARALASLLIEQHR
jgi:hypothetical protein